MEVSFIMALLEFGGDAVVTEGFVILAFPFEVNRLLLVLLVQVVRRFHGLSYIVRGSR
jgi:hypothetical protein